MANEPERQRALDACRGVDTVPAAAFDEIVKLAGAICGTPIALVSLSDHDRQWFKARVGLDVRRISRCGAFCDLAIQTPGQLGLGCRSGPPPPPTPTSPCSTCSCAPRRR